MRESAQFVNISIFKIGKPRTSFQVQNRPLIRFLLWLVKKISVSFILFPHEYITVIMEH